MARMKSRWYLPFAIEAFRPYSVDRHRATVLLSIRVRRWHPALWWMVLRTIHPRELLTIGGWIAVVRVIWRAGR